MSASAIVLLGSLITCCKSEVVINAIALDDILSEDYMPTTLLMLENPKIISKYENSTASGNINKNILGLDGSLGKAMETMDFHRSMMNQYMCRSFVAEQIVANMSTSRVKRRMGHVTSGIGESSTPQTDISKNLIYDEGSSGYQDWLSKSATLEDIYRHYDNPQDRIDVVEDVDDGNPEDFEEGYNVEDINKQETKAALNHRHEETYYSAGGYPGPSYSNSYGPPNYSPSSYSQQNYNPPNYNQPSYNQPSYSQPSYGQPTYGSPDYHQNTGVGGGYPQHQPESHGSYEPHYQEPEYHNSPAPKYHVYNYYSKDKDLSDLFEIALTGLAFLAFKMFIVHVIMCIATTTTTNTTTTTVAMAMSMSPTATGTGNGMADIPGTGGTSTGGGMTSTGGGMPSTGADMPGTGGGMTSTGGGMTSTGGGMTGDGGDTPGTGGGMTSDGGDMPSTGGGMTGDGGDTPGTGGGMTSDGGDMPGTGSGMTSDGGDMPGTGGGMTSDGSDMPGTGGGMTGTGDGMTDDGMTDMGGGMTGGGTGTGDGGDGSTDMGGTGSGTTGTGNGMDGGTGGDSTGTGGTDGGTGMGTTGSDSTGTGGSSAMDTGMDNTAADGSATGDGSDTLQFRYKRNPMPHFPNPNNEIVNELSRKILLTIESALVGHKDDGVCLRKILCENNKWSRDLEGRHKLFIPLWSLGMSWLSGKIVHNVAPATSMLDTLKASILGLGKANCEIIYQKCDLQNHVMERKKRKRRKREAL